MNYIKLLVKWITYYLYYKYGVGLLLLILYALLLAV